MTQNAAPIQNNVFLALLPDIVAAEEISRLAAQLRTSHGLRGQPLDTEKFHVTLAFLGANRALSDSFIPSACQAMKTVRAAPFDVCFDRAFSFSGKENARKPLVLLCGDGEEELHAFRSHIGYALTMGGLGKVFKPKFTPHITMLYDRWVVDEISVKPVRWTVREFSLVRSYVGEGRYECIAKWPLG